MKNWNFKNIFADLNSPNFSEFLSVFGFFSRPILIFCPYFSYTAGKSNHRRKLHLPKKKRPFQPQILGKGHSGLERAPNLEPFLAPRALSQNQWQKSATFLFRKK